MFNFKKAWDELAGPALLSLPQSSLELCLRVHHEAANLKQNPDLRLTWVSEDLKKAFMDLDPEELAIASRVVWSAGHWYPGYPSFLKELCFSGTYWRFSIYADTIIREGMYNNRKRTYNNEDIFMEIHEGMIDVVMNYSGLFSRTSITLATPENINAIEHLIDEEVKLIRNIVANKTEERQNKIYDSYDKFVANAKKELQPKEGLVFDMLNLERYDEQRE